MARRRFGSQRHSHRAALATAGVRRRAGRRTTVASLVSPAVLPPAPAVEAAAARASDLAHAQWPASLCALLLGATAYMLVRGTTTALPAGNGGPERGNAVAAGCLLVLALGVRIPQRFMVWACALAWRTVHRHGRADRAPIRIRPGGGDRAFYWLVVSVLALATGLCATLSPLTVHLGRVTYALFEEHFLWGWLTADWLLAFCGAVSATPSFVMLGVALAGLHHLSCRVGQWDAKATAWTLIGGAGTSLFLGWRTEVTATTSLLLCGASLPAFVVALIAGCLAGSPGGEEKTGSVGEAAAVPLFSDRWPTLLRASLVAIGGGTACAVAVWTYEAVPSSGIAGLVLAAGIGLLLGGSAEVSRFSSIGALGAACCVCGAIVGGGGLWIGGPATGTPWARVLAAGCGAGAIGFATGYARRTLLLRVASPNAAGAQVLGRLLICSAGTLAVTSPIAIQLFGPRATLVLLALSMIVLGGMLALHDPSPAPGDRRYRLGAVFGSLAVILAVTAFPSATRQRAVGTLPPSPSAAP